MSDNLEIFLFRTESWYNGESIFFLTQERAEDYSNTFTLDHYYLKYTVSGEGPWYKIFSEKPFGAFETDAQGLPLPEEEQLYATFQEANIKGVELGNRYNLDHIVREIKLTVGQLYEIKAIKSSMFKNTRAF